MVKSLPHDGVNTNITGVSLRPFTLAAKHTEEVFTSDYMSQIGLCYAYNRGSVRIKAIGDVILGDRWCEIYTVDPGTAPDPLLTDTTVV